MSKKLTKFISLDSFIQKQQQLNVENKIQYAVQENKNVNFIKKLLDQYDDLEHILLYQSPFQDLKICVCNKLSGDPPIHVNYKNKISCLYLNQFMELCNNRSLSRNGKKFQGIIRMFVDDREVTMFQLQQLVVNHYETKNINYSNNISEKSLLKVELVFQLSDMTRNLYIHQMPYCPIALNCYLDLRGWRVFKCKHFIDKEWIIQKSSLSTSIQRSEDGCYHIKSIDDLILFSGEK